MEEKSKMVENSFENKKIWVAGHRGMVGSAICRRLEREDCTVLTATRDQVDLQDRNQVNAFYEANRPDMVFVAAAKVGGILANDTKPVDFLLENLEIQNNVIPGAHAHDVEKLMFLGSSCIYPKFAPQPITEDALLTGPLEATNEWYAIAKIAGIRLCQAYRKQYGRNFISAMPTNLYGPNDNFDPLTSHVLPALMQRAIARRDAGERGMTIWGTGSPMREFMHVDDLADACIYVMKHYDEADHINIGTGSDIAIADLARIVMDVVGLEGDLDTDTSKPDGTPRKLMSSQRLNDLGWKPSIDLRDGIRSTYEWYSDTIGKDDRTPAFGTG